MLIIEESAGAPERRSAGAPERRSAGAPERPLSLILIGLLVSSLNLPAQDAGKVGTPLRSSPRVIGVIDTGDNLAHRPISPRSQGQPKGRTIYQPMTAPRGAEDTAATQRPAPREQGAESSRNERLTSFLFPVEAIRYPNDLFLVNVHHQGTVYPFWSSADWRNLDVVTGVRDRRQAFHFLLSLRTAPPSERTDRKDDSQAMLPKLSRQQGPHFTPARETDRQETSAPVLAFLEAIHQFYAEREADLVEATTKRKSNRARFRRRQQEAGSQSAEPPADIVVRYRHSEPEPLPAHLQPENGKEKVK